MTAPDHLLHVFIKGLDDGVLHRVQSLTDSQEQQLLRLAGHEKELLVVFNPVFRVTGLTNKFFPAPTSQRDWHRQAASLVRRVYSVGDKCNSFMMRFSKGGRSVTCHCTCCPACTRVAVISIRLMAFKHRPAVGYAVVRFG